MSEKRVLDMPSEPLVQAPANSQPQKKADMISGEKLEAGKSSNNARGIFLFRL